MNLILTEYPPARGFSGFALLAIGSQAVEAARITMNGKTMTEIMERGRSIAKKKDVANASKEPALARSAAISRSTKALEAVIHLSKA